MPCPRWRAAGWPRRCGRAARPSRCRRGSVASCCAWWAGYGSPPRRSGTSCSAGLATGASWRCGAPTSCSVRGRAPRGTGSLRAPRAPAGPRRHRAAQRASPRASGARGGPCRRRAPRAARVDSRDWGGPPAAPGRPRQGHGPFAAAGAWIWALRRQWRQRQRPVRAACAAPRAARAWQAAAGAAAARRPSTQPLLRSPRTAGVFLAAGVVSSLIRRWRERFDARASQIRHLRERMRGAGSYAEWRELAAQLDVLDANRVGGRCSFEEGSLYDRKLLEQKLAHLQAVREGGNIREVMFNLRSDLIRNVANVAKRCGGRGAVLGLLLGPARRRQQLAGRRRPPQSGLVRGGAARSPPRGRGLAQQRPLTLPAPLHPRARCAPPAPQPAARALLHGACDDPRLHRRGAGAAVDAVGLARGGCEHRGEAGVLQVGAVGGLAAGWGAAARRMRTVVASAARGSQIPAARQGSAPLTARPHAPPLPARREVRHAYGRTALLLSGGGGLGSFHIVSGASLLGALAWPRCCPLP
jgi:hypothetical protein